jgi:CPA2 family monovalent cation:H+ antiporter-2
MLMSETEFKHQVEADIRPFHDVLLGLFFITIGMMLDWRPVVERWALVLVLLTLPLAFKLLLVTVARARASARPWACRCAPACTWRRPASSASCC